MKNKGVLVLAIIVVLCFGLMWVFHSPAQVTTASSGQARQALISALSVTNNQISLSAAKTYIANFKTTNQVNRRGGVFPRKVIDKLLSQPKVVAIRLYYSQSATGASSMVLVGVDATGADMATANDQIIDEWAPCPPFCDFDSPLY